MLWLLLLLLLLLELLVQGPLTLQKVRIDVDGGRWMLWRERGRLKRRHLMHRLTLQQGRRCASHLEIGINVHLPRHGRQPLVGAQVRQHLVKYLGKSIDRKRFYLW